MFHFPSFLIGYVSGVGTTLLAKRFAPALSELATAGYGFTDSLSAALAARMEDLEDALAEARARATAGRAAAAPPPKARVLRAVPKRPAAKAPRRRSAKKRKTASRRRKQA